MALHALTMQVYILICCELSINDLVRIRQFELPAISCPAYARMTAAVCQKLQQKLPELNGPTAY